jgi:hypothetical protein
MLDTTPPVTNTNLAARAGIRAEADPSAYREGKLLNAAL